LPLKRLHRQRLFDEHLGKVSKGDWKPFDDEDCRRYVDGKPRCEGVKSFLESRGSELSYGSLEDGPKKQTIFMLGNRKNRYFNELIETGGANVYEPAMARALKIRGRMWSSPTYRS
jgi:hypothetical protein